MPKELESGSHESPDDSSSNTQTLELLCHLDNTAHGNMACVMWEPMGDGKKIISLADNNILLWDLQESSTKAVLSSSAALEGKGQLRFTSGRWSPHHNCTQIATANDTTVRGWDTRSMRWCVHSLVKGFLFFPSAPILTCMLHFTQLCTSPEIVCSMHRHYQNEDVRYINLKTRIVDGCLLSFLLSFFFFFNFRIKEPLQDSVIATYEEHEDSVYAVEWSSADPWLFASLSYDGRLVINRVPRALKYHILL
uniref:Protein TSSC1 n=1 Tax=Pavo cristatus TaxID=9049 RepID=A0A8C9ESU8_PAVCR